MVDHYSEEFIKSLRQKKANFHEVVSGLQIVILLGSSVKYRKKRSNDSPRFTQLDSKLCVGDSRFLGAS